jgi:arylsulfatase
MRKPNILLLYSDQHRWDAVGAAGNKDLRTPHLDALAQDSQYFTHAFVQCPVCMPSRASFLTGQYPGTLGIPHMGVPVPEDTVTLPRLLAPHGYRSANIGKLHFQPHANRDHRLPHPSYGFDQLEISDEPGCYEDAYRAFVRAKRPEQLDRIACGLPPAANVWQETMRGSYGYVERENKREEHRTRAFAGDDDLTHTAFVSERTQETIRAFADRPREPWLCVAGFYSPHSPWIAPQKCLDRYKPDALTLAPAAKIGGVPEATLRQATHGYYAMISEVDDHIGAILRTLRETGQEENTIVLYTSDHGEWLGRYGRFGKGTPGDDSVSRVPLMLRLPRAFGIAPRRVETIVEAVDVLPTLLEIAAIPVPPTLQGRSLLQPRADASALCEMNDWKSIRTERYRYVVNRAGKETFYDLHTDPEEQKNIAEIAAYGSDLAAHRHLLLTRLLSRERPLSRTWPY